MEETMKDEELEQAEQEAKAAEAKPGITIKLTKPLRHEGKEFTDLTLDFDNLHGSDVENIESELLAMGSTTVNHTINTPFLIRLAAHASGIGADILYDLPAEDFSNVRNAARNYIFFADTGERKDLFCWEGSVTVQQGDEVRRWTKMEFRFGDLTGQDCEDVEQEANREGWSIFDYRTSPQFHRRICAKAAGVPAEALAALSAYDYLRVRNAARDFFMK